ncbi:glycosyltransferase family 9 protein [Nocardia veterana]|uniref:Glycosyltransferase family 9 protein n=1 Tax=Nocardia veterana TaxID=132249 RepID=A0A7X6LZ91_9NOCA|nr:glycosyltransferase family 9 protein [Nocardia veterana]NKY87375.1 glycosyltransferase family 9 protein [Nocardia veterana]
MTVLVLRALGLGDLLTAVPALRAVRAARPGESLVLAAPDWLRPIVDLVGGVDRLLPTAGLGALRWDGEPPDLAINLHGSGPQSIADLIATRPRRLLTHRHPAFPAIDGPAWQPDTHEVVRWCRLLGSAAIAADPTALGIRPPGTDAAATGHIVVHAGGSSPARRWPAERFAIVAARLRRAGYRIVLTGDAGEVETATAVADAAGLSPDSVLAGRQSLTELTGTVARAALLISGDTGIGHLATAVGTPSVLIFGPNPPAWWGPPRDPAHIALWAGRIGDPHAPRPDPGLLLIEPDQVLAAAARQLRCFGSRRGGTAPTSHWRTTTLGKE